MASFTHLHVHSEYSLLESAVTIQGLIGASKQLGMESVALTDKYMMSGAVEFHNAAVSAGIKPIIGCELCISDSDGYYHITLLAKNRQGYGNLCRLVSRSHLDRRRPFPAVDADYLARTSGGIIGLSGCVSGKIPQLLKKGLRDRALREAGRYADIFSGDFYIELQRFPVSKASGDSLSEVLASFASDAGIPVAATNDVHYLKPGDYGTYRSLFKLKTMRGKKDPVPAAGSCGENYFKSAEAMGQLFKDIPEAVLNTSAISDKCSLVLDTGKVYLPVFRAASEETEAGRLKRLCLAGLDRRSGCCPQPVYLSRLKSELSIIDSTGFSGYFLMIADMVSFAAEKEIPICGKGSAAGSLVSYLLGISDVDPVKLDLFFERFLNPERKEPPDIDIDICSKRRGEILKYLRSRYGSLNVSRVCSFSTLRARAAIRETGRIMGLAKDDVDDIVRQAAVHRHFPGRKLPKNSLGDKASPGTFTGTVISSAGRIENFVRHLSMHPSAFIISCTDLFKVAPLTLSDTGEVMTQYDMDSIKELGLIKTDLIGSISLSLIGDVAKSLLDNRGIKLDMSFGDYADSRAYDIISRGKTLGVFQLESSGIRSLAKKLKPSSLNDITLLISLYRPGPQQSGMVKNFIERKFGREKVSYPHRDLEPILGDTYGVILYQEQVMKIALKMAGYSLSQADSLRKAMTGLSREVMKRQRYRFVKGSVNRGYSLHTAADIFGLISKFASYGFLKAHAAAYSAVSYRLAYLKAYYPAELISAILSNNSGYYGSSSYIEEARRLGLALKLPDINKSGTSFTAEDCGKSIRVPLTSIKGLGFSGAASIIKERSANGPFKDFLDFYRRSRQGLRINKNAIENIIRSGGFDYSKSSRSSLLAAFQYLETIRHFPDTVSHPSLNPLFNLSYGSQSLEKTLKDELEILGFCITASPLEYFRDELGRYAPVGSGSFGSIAGAGDIYCAGIVINRRVEKTKSGSKMLFCTIEDADGIFEAVFFPVFYLRHLRALSSGRALVVRGEPRYRDGDITIMGKEAIDLAILKRLNRSHRKESLKQDILVESGPLWKEK